MPSRITKVGSSSLATDAVAAEELRVEKRRHRRGPRSSPAKACRDAERAEQHKRVGMNEVVPELSGSNDLRFESALEPIAEQRSLTPRKLVEVKQDAQKQAERIRLRNGMVLPEPTPISGSTHTRHAPGNAVKADALHLEVGGKQLLEDAKLLISGDVATYGLVGPNGCGKTTLLRLISGSYVSDFNIPLPKNWGQPYLVDQLDPEPTGRSPLEEVLSSHKERSALLNERDALIKQLEHVNAEDVEFLSTISEQIEDLDGRLSYFDADEQKVTRMLVGLGFHDGEQAIDGVPSLKAKDELITDENVEINQLVEVRDQDDEDWLRGVVTSINPLMVRPADWMESYAWSKVRHVNELSGGWRKKIQLAKALYDHPRLLLLDEPTNHLDFHARLYLEEQLKSYGCQEKGHSHDTTVLIVSHDSCFLKEVCDQALQIVDRKVLTKPMSELSLEGLAAIQSCNEAKREKWRFAYPAADRAHPEMHALSFHHVGFGYSPDAMPVFQDINRLSFHGKSRSVLIGRNGSGKSTLLKLCLGLAKPTEGEVHADTCKVRHFSQHFNEQLDRHPELSAVSYLVRHCADSLKRRCGGSDEDRMRDQAGIILKRFGLERQQAWNMSVAELSGGQKARVNFAFLSLCPAHLLILDEPTNHLDASGLEHLADALEAFEGGVVLISHDELLIRRVLSSSAHSELLICRGGSVHEQRGLQGFDTYRRTAFKEQFLRAQEAEVAAAKRLQRDRESRKAKGLRCGLSKSAASTREPTPDLPRSTQGKEPKPSITLESVFGKKKKKAKPLSLQT